MAKGDGEILVADSVYGPTRRFCDTMLARLGVRTLYFDPRIGAGVSDLISDRTCGIFMESPGSGAFEIQDVPAITAAARARGVAIRAVMLERLGPNVWHTSPAAAMAVLEELEETARLWLTTDPRPAPLDEAQLDELRTHFGAAW